MIWRMRIRSGEEDGNALAPFAGTFGGEHGGKAGPTVGRVGTLVWHSQEGVGEAIQRTAVRGVVAGSEEMEQAVLEDRWGERGGCVRQTVAGASPQPDDRMGMMAINAEGTEFAVEFEVIEGAAQEGEMGLRGHATGKGDVDVRGILFRVGRSGEGVNGFDGDVEEPAEEVEMMGAQIEEDTSGGGPFALPHGQGLPGRGFAEGGLDRSYGADDAGAEELSGEPMDRVVPAVEAEPGGDSRGADGLERLEAVFGGGGKGLFKEEGFVMADGLEGEGSVEL